MDYWRRKRTNCAMPKHPRDQANIRSTCCSFLSPRVKQCYGDCDPLANIVLVPFFSSLEMNWFKRPASR